MGNTPEQSNYPSTRISNYKISQHVSEVGYYSEYPRDNKQTLLLASRNYFNSNIPNTKTNRNQGTSTVITKAPNLSNFNDSPLKEHHSRHSSRSRHTNISKTDTFNNIPRKIIDLTPLLDDSLVSDISQVNRNKTKVDIRINRIEPKKHSKSTDHRVNLKVNKHTNFAEISNCHNRTLSNETEEYYDWYGVSKYIEHKDSNRNWLRRDMNKSGDSLLDFDKNGLSWSRFITFKKRVNTTEDYKKNTSTSRNVPQVPNDNPQDLFKSTNNHLKNKDNNVESSWSDIDDNYRSNNYINHTTRNNNIHNNIYKNNHIHKRGNDTDFALSQGNIFKNSKEQQMLNDNFEEKIDDSYYMWADVNMNKRKFKTQIEREPQWEILNNKPYEWNQALPPRSKPIEQDRGGMALQCYKYEDIGIADKIIKKKLKKYNQKTPLVWPKNRKSSKPKVINTEKPQTKYNVIASERKEYNTDYSNIPCNNKINIYENEKNDRSTKYSNKPQLRIEITKDSKIDKTWITNHLNSSEYLVLTYTTLDKTDSNCILYDGDVFKILNSKSGYKIAGRYFQITKTAFKYYNSMSSSQLYKNKPLVQFDIRHIANIVISNDDFLKYKFEKIGFAFTIFLDNAKETFQFGTEDPEYGSNIIKVWNMIKGYHLNKLNNSPVDFRYEI